MRRILNITAETYQRHTVLFEESEIILILRYYPKIQAWFFDVEYNDRTVRGVKLSLGTLHILSSSFPFDFIVTDALREGLDPFRRVDFSEGRCLLYMLEAADMEEIRGDSVPL